MAPREFLIFISSPGDVSDERSLARRVLARLNEEPFIRDVARLTEVSWDNPNGPVEMDARYPPQEALKLRLPCPSACDIVAVILWSRMGTILAGERKSDGTPYLSGTEYEFEKAISSDKPSVFLYRRIEKVFIDQDDRERAEKESQYAKVKAFFASLINPDTSIKRLQTTYQSPSEFERRFENDVRRTLYRLLKESQSHEETSPAVKAAPAYTGSPYPGLRKLTGNDSAVFYGRGREVDELVKRFRDASCRFTAVVGASGSGKSSVVLAGLLPRLAEGALPGSKDWPVAIFTPADEDDNPFRALASALKPFLKGEVRKTKELAAALEKHPQSIEDICEAALVARPDSAELVVCVDQFEEMFTIADPERQRQFSHAMTALAKLNRVRTVVTVRADFIPGVSRFAGLAELIQHGHYLLMPPTIAALADIVRMPAERAGIDLEAGLLDRILTDTGSEPGALPLLAYTMEQLYTAAKSSGMMTHKSYDSLGGLKGAISRRAEESFGQLDESAQAALPRLFTRLLSIAPSGIVTRKKALQTDVYEDAASQRLVSQLVEARLLISDQRGGNSTVEVAHEALFGSWSRLKRWIDDNLEFFLWRNRLKFRMDEWERAGREETLALSGHALQEARRWTAQYAQLSQAERDYIAWTETEEFERRRVLTGARELLLNEGRETPQAVKVHWLMCILLSGDIESAERLASDCGIASLLDDARSGAASELARAGEYENSRLLAGGINAEESRWLALTRIAAVAAGQGQTSVAASIVRSIPDVQHNSYALRSALALAPEQVSSDGDPLCDLAENALNSGEAATGHPDPRFIVALVRNGRWNRAFSTALASLPHAARVDAAVQIVQALRKKPEIARELLTGLTEDIEGVTDIWWRGAYRIRAARAACYAGLTDDAFQIVSSIEDPEQRRVALAQLACWHASFGDLASATKYARQAAEGWKRPATPAIVAHHLLDVAGYLAAASHCKDASDLASMSHDFLTSGSADDPSRILHALCRIAQTQATCGELDGLLPRLRGLSERWRHTGFRGVARGLLVQGCPTSVLKVSRDATLTMADRAALLSEAFMILWTRSDFDAAAGVAEIVNTCLARGSQAGRSYRFVLTQVAAGLVMSGKLERLVNSLMEVDSKADRAEILLEAAENLARSGSIEHADEVVDRAKQFAEQIESYHSREKAYARLAKILGRRRRFAEARDVADRCAAPGERLGAYSEILRYATNREIDLSTVTAHNRL